MSRLHVICKNGRHLKRIKDIGPDMYESGYWPIAEDNARHLIGGTLYLHETKAEPSYFGGKVEDFRRADGEWPQHPERLIFTVRSTRDAKGQQWRGDTNSMAWIGGVVDD